MLECLHSDVIKKTSSSFFLPLLLSLAPVFQDPPHFLRRSPARNVVLTLYVPHSCAAFRPAAWTAGKI